MSRWSPLMAALSCATLVGCASPDAERALSEATVRYAAVREDSDVLRSAPKDVVRAGESLARAERFASYLGASADVEHYAYLSQRYAEIARLHAELQRSEERASRLRMERDRLRAALHEASLLSAQQQDRWLHDQMLSLAASETDRGLVMSLSDVLFQSGSTQLAPSANRTLISLARFLQLNPQRIIRIEGYTDNRGDAQANLALSEARAQAVAQMLVDLGVDGTRIEAVGYGEQHPLTENASERGRAQNRRVEIVLSDGQGRLAPPR